ncbi:MAG: hypothetical protein JRJ29_09080 [Deltaproteobacteria bacterium]|nr:hypothetical protein [Deltaproteobacteria bacterium]
MSKEKSYFGIGLVFGILMTALALYYVAPRYTTVGSGTQVIKQDRWSGQSWRLVGDQWKPITGAERNWVAIDKVLMSALRIPTDRKKRASTLDLLRNKYPILKEIPDEELLERIKLVYSREILVNLYLNDFRKLERKEDKIDSKK